MTALKLKDSCVLFIVGITANVSEDSLLTMTTRQDISVVYSVDVVMLVWGIFKIAPPY